MSRERMTSESRRVKAIEGAIMALERAVTAADDAELESWADELAKEEKDVVSQSVPAGKVELKDEGDQNARANANWPLTEEERMNVASRLVQLAKKLVE